MTLHFLNDVANDAESTQTTIIKSKSLPRGKLINGIPGSCLLISSLPESAFRTRVESLGKPRDVRTLVESLGNPRDVNKRSQSITW